MSHERILFVLAWDLSSRDGIGYAVRLLDTSEPADEVVHLFYGAVELDAGVNRIEAVDRVAAEAGIDRSRVLYVGGRK